MSFLDTPLSAVDNEPKEPEESRVIDITKELRKAQKDVDAGDGVTKVIRVGRYEFELVDAVSAVAMSNLSEATSGETTQVHLLVAGLTKLIAKKDRAGFQDFLEDEEVTAAQLGALVEQIISVITGKE